MDFEILNNLNFDKNYEKLDEVKRKNYNPYLINRGLSYFPDSVLQANAMNLRSFLDKQTQFDYLFHAVRKRKRFSRWHKKTNFELVPIITEVLECSPREAEKYANMITESMAYEIRNVYGGTTKPK